jgi:hypothetical protein
MFASLGPTSLQPKTLSPSPGEGGRMRHKKGKTTEVATAVNRSAEVTSQVLEKETQECGA